MSSMHVCVCVREDTQQGTEEHSNVLPQVCHQDHTVIGHPCSLAYNHLVCVNVLACSIVRSM